MSAGSRRRKPEVRSSGYIVHEGLTAMSRDIEVDLLLFAPRGVRTGRIVSWVTDSTLLDPDVKKKDRGSTVAFTLDGGGLPIPVNWIEGIRRTVPAPGA